MNENIDFEYTRFGERGWLATCNREIDDVACGLFVNTIADLVRSQKGISDAVAGINSITIRFDGKQLNANEALAYLKGAAKKANAPWATNHSKF